jgi:hypothetical protein
MLLPLFPLLVRGALQLFRKFQIGGSNNKVQNVYAMRRLYLYLLLTQVRGWILYMLFGAIEALLVSSAGSNCWYEELLHHDTNYSECQGRATDFSDHVVLYFAQILPIALTEVLHSFVIPFWDTKTSTRKNGGYSSLVPIVLLAGLFYLYLITFLGAYKTAVYFHTGPEVLSGYLVSLCIQVPLCLMQCTNYFPRAREFFFGQVLP